MMAAAMILLVCLAAFAVVWTMEGVQCLTVFCGCGLRHARNVYAVTGKAGRQDESTRVAAALTALCPVCRRSEASLS